MMNHSVREGNLTAKSAPATFACETIYLDLRGNRVPKDDARKVMTIYRDSNDKAARITLAFL